MNQPYANVANQRQCRLTTYDRQTGGAHDDEMLFYIEDNTLYLVSWESGRATWVQNVLRNPEVSIQIGNQKFAGMARVVTSDAEATHIREMLSTKYADGQTDPEMNARNRTGLPVAVELSPDVH